MMTSTTNRRALVIGAGIAGPVAAMALQRAGIDSRVYESRAGQDGRGSYLTVATNGLDALRAIDAHRPVIEAGFPTSWISFESGRGHRLGTVPIGSLAAGRDASCTIRRADLQRVLHDEACRRGVAFSFGKRLARVHPAAGGICAEFEDGSRDHGDLLIGCDGVHSATRRLIDPHAPAPRYVGLLNFGGYTPAVSASEPGCWHMIFGRRAFFGYVADERGGTVWFANVPRAATTSIERETTAIDDWRRLLIELFASDRGPAADLIARGDLELAGDNTHDLPSVPVWRRGAMIIIGDAAHAPSPSAGQGASMAVEDGVVLAQCLRDVPDVATAFATFERIRRDRVERIVAQGARNSQNKAAGAIGRVFRDLAMPLILRRFVNERTTAWLYDHHLDWNQPVIAPDDIVQKVEAAVG